MRQLRVYMSQVACKLVGERLRGFLFLLSDNVSSWRSFQFNASSFLLLSIGYFAGALSMLDY